MKKPAILNEFQKKSVLAHFKEEYGVFKLILEIDHYDQAFYTLFFRLNDIMFSERVIYNTRVYHPDKPSFDDFIKEAEFKLSHLKESIEDSVFNYINIGVPRHEELARSLYQLIVCQHDNLFKAGIFGDCDYVFTAEIYDICLNKLKQGKTPLKVLEECFKLLNVTNEKTLDMINNCANTHEEGF